MGDSPLSVSQLGGQISNREAEVLAAHRATTGSASLLHQVTEANPNFKNYEELGRAYLLLPLEVLDSIGIDGQFGPGAPTLAIGALKHAATRKALASTASRGLWKITKEGTERAVRHRKFGTFSKSKADGLWWSRDQAGHGGSKWKIFEETGEGLKWKADADEFGDFITGNTRARSASLSLVAAERGEL